MSQFGFFSDDGREYVITKTETPKPMLNYAWNSRYLTGINHFGGGDGAYGGRTACYIDPQGRGRCSLVRNGNRYFYFKDKDSGEVWNPGWYPVRKALDSYRCTHGAGYSVIESSLAGIRTVLRVFVHPAEPAEIWTLRIFNETKRDRRIGVFSFVEYSLEGYARYSDYHSYVHSERIGSSNTLICYNEAQERPHDWFNGFTSSSRDIAGFDTSLKSFLGKYGSIAAPERVATGKCGDSLAACEIMAGVLQNDLEIPAGSEECFHILFGAAPSAERALEIVQTIFSPGVIERDFEELTQAKERAFGKISVETPEKRIDRLVNRWIKQQVQLCAEIGRDTGKGFRDQLQDAWAIASFNPELARSKILETLTYQYSDGRCVRGWLPLDHHIYSDGPVWIAPAVNGYIKETGDTRFLDERARYLDTGDGTVWEHILTAARYSSDDLGERGLVLAHDGDWNDSLNGIGTGGKGESVWTSIALYHALNQTAEMAREIRGEPEIELEMKERAVRIKKAVDAQGWDGEWYLAAFNDEGIKVGSQTEREGRVYLNSQTWAVLSGLAEGEHLEKCLRAIDEKLDSPYGPLTLTPAYTRYNPGIGRLTGFVPGIWENGTPYCHGGAFKIVADCCSGRGNEAMETLLKILPDSGQNPSDVSGCEPYALTNMYFGPENPRRGQVLFAWVTGAAGWMFRAVTQYILGFHPGYDSVTIKPCIPDSWNSCRMTRVFRNDTYRLEVVRRSGTEKRRARITVDGIDIQGDTFQLAGDGKEHRILVEL